MKKLFRVQVVEIDPETKEEKVVHLDDNYTGLTIVAETEDGKMAEVILNDNIMGIACKLASGQKTAPAVRLAKVFMELKQNETEDKEAALLRAIMGE